MSVNASLALIATGAILKYAVTTALSWVSLPTVGVVLMVVGFVGLLLSPVGLLGIARGTDTLRQKERPTVRASHRTPSAHPGQPPVLTAYDLTRRG